jgi:neurotransmitter:Na+ symporter, NSS family
MANSNGTRERWATRIGLVLAMAGNAIGIGNFLRFPGQAAANGGGAFMIPYFIALIFMAIPLMWLEWAQGRYGGARGHGTTPGMFQLMWRSRISKYLGVLGLFLPTVILIYYSYLASWTIGYSIYTVFNQLPKVQETGITKDDLAALARGEIRDRVLQGLPITRADVDAFLTQGVATSQMVKFLKTLNLAEKEITQLSPKERVEKLEAAIIKEQIVKPFDNARKAYTGAITPDGQPVGDIYRVPLFTYLVFIGVFVFSLFVLARGISGGIEVLAKVGMPLLFILAVILVIRVFTLGHPVSEALGPLNGLAFLWEPKWFIERNGREVFVLFDPQVWLAAAGQIFFTLSLGMGAIQCYASYLREEDDVALTGLSTTSANEFAEVVLGGSIAIPAAATFFGITATQVIASQGTFYLGFASMPPVFEFMPLGQVLGALWFFLLFIAAITSVMALAQPMIAFLEDEFGLPRGKAVAILGALWLPSTHLCIFLSGSLDVMDFWAGTFGPPLFALIEVVLMMWIFGADRIWAEILRGAQLRPFRFFYYSAKYIAPLILAFVLGFWVWLNIVVPILNGTILQQGVEGQGTGWTVWLTRLFLLALFIAMCLMVRVAFKRKEVTA